MRKDINNLQRSLRKLENNLSKIKNCSNDIMNELENDNEIPIYIKQEFLSDLKGFEHSFKENLNNIMPAIYLSLLDLNKRWNSCLDIENDIRPLKKKYFATYDILNMFKGTFTDHTQMHQVIRFMIQNNLIVKDGGFHYSKYIINEHGIRNKYHLPSEILQLFIFDFFSDKQHDLNELSFNDDKRLLNAKKKKIISFWDKVKPLILKYYSR